MTVVLFLESFINRSCVSDMRSFQILIFGIVCSVQGVAHADSTEIFVRLNANPFSAPYYIFSNTENGEAITPVLVTGSTYVFTRTDSGHPFNIGSGWRQADLGLSTSSTGSGNSVSGVASIESGQKITVQIPSDFSGSAITYYCYLHSSMVSTISVTNGSNSLDNGGTFASDYFESVDSDISLNYSDYRDHSLVSATDLDVNLDGSADLVLHFFSSEDGLSGDLLEKPTPNHLKIFVQTQAGEFEDQTELFLQETKPDLGGASRHVVKGDFNNDGKLDLAFAMNWEDRRLVEDPSHLSVKLAALLSTSSGYEIKSFGTPSFYHSLGVGKDSSGRAFVTGNGFSGNFQAELWRFDENNEPIQIESAGLEIPPNAFEFLSHDSGLATELLLRNANFPDMFGIEAYKLEGASWKLVDRIGNPYESLGTISSLGWNATDYSDVSVIEINGYPSLEGGGSSYAESCAIRLMPDQPPIGVFKVSSATIPSWGEIEKITDEDTVAFNSLVGFSFSGGKIAKDLLHIESEEVFTNTNFFDCSDLDGDGYDDIVIYPYDQSPVVYINNQEGSFYRLDENRIPNGSNQDVWYYGQLVQYSSMLRDFTGDDIPDLLYFPSGIPENRGDEIGQFLELKLFRGTQLLTKNALDTDGDSISDANEERLGLDPLSADSDGDGKSDPLDAFPLDSNETDDTDGDGVGDNADAFDLDASESLDTDGDGIGNNADLDDDGDGFTDEEELADGTNPLSRFSCKSGCFSFDIDENSQAKALTDGLLVIRHLFGFTGDALATGAISTDATRDRAEDISALLADADSELDIDGNGESKALSDGLLLIRYLFGFTGDALTVGAIGEGATRDTSETIEAYISDRVPASE